MRLEWITERISPLADIIACIVVLPGEILFAYMVENVVNAGYHLIVRQRQRVFRVQYSEPGHDLLIREHMTDLLMGVRVRDHGSRVHL